MVFLCEAGRRVVRVKGARHMPLEAVIDLVARIVLEACPKGEKGLGVVTHVFGRG